MSNNPSSEQGSYGEYKGYTPQPSQADPYSPDEMPQSSYPQPPSHPGEEAAYTEQEAGYGQQQYQVPPYGQQQQQQYQVPPYGQQQQYQVPPYGQQQQYQQSAYGQQYQTQYGKGSQERLSMGLKVRTAAILSCLFGWIGGLIFILLERDNRYVRFTAMQSLLFFGGLSIVEAGVRTLPFLGALNFGLGVLGFIVWIVLLRAAVQGRYYKLPIVGDYAERLAERFR